jgi:hypothetical protein
MTPNPDDDRPQPGPLVVGADLVQEHPAGGVDR